MDELLLNDHEKYIWGEKQILLGGKFQIFSKCSKWHSYSLNKRSKNCISIMEKFHKFCGNDYLDTVLNCKDSMSYAKKFQSKYKNKKYIVTI